MAVYNYDVVVLGSGPAGEGAAMNAAKAGRKVAVVDNRPLVGGNCTHLGTIPSKALRHSVRQIMQYNTNPLFRQIGEPRWFSFPDVLKSAERVIAKQVASRTGYYARNRIDVFFGTASFSDEQTLASRPTAMACTRWQATSGSGAPIGSRRATTSIPRPTSRCRRSPPAGARCAAAPSCATPRIATATGWPGAASTRPPAQLRISVSAS